MVGYSLQNSLALPLFVVSARPVRTLFSSCISVLYGSSSSMGFCFERGASLISEVPPFVKFSQARDLAVRHIGLCHQRRTIGNYVWYNTGVRVGLCQSPIWLRHMISVHASFFTVACILSPTCNCWEATLYSFSTLRRNKNKDNCRTF